MPQNEESVGGVAHIGKCEVLFCPRPAARTIYSPIYGRELVVCKECHDNRTSDGSSDSGSKREEFGQLVRRLGI